MRRETLIKWAFRGKSHFSGGAREQRVGKGEIEETEEKKGERREKAR